MQRELANITESCAWLGVRGCSNWERFLRVGRQQMLSFYEEKDDWVGGWSAVLFFDLSKAFQYITSSQTS